jgi:hypothetical protein
LEFKDKVAPPYARSLTSLAVEWCAIKAPKATEARGLFILKKIENLMTTEARGQSENNTKIRPALSR